jgi:hypothetical protein
MGIQTFLKLLLDKQSVDQAKRDAEKAGKETAGALTTAARPALDGFLSFVKGVGAGIAAAFSVHAVVAFARSAIDEAEKVKRGWGDVAAAVNAAGGNFDRMRDRIDKVSNDIAHRFAFDDDEIRAGFTNLLRQTGNVEQSLRGVEVAAKLARAGHISVAEAATLLGRAMETGVTRGLVPFVGQLDKTRPILDQVAKRLGDVEGHISPMAIGAADLSRAWGDFKEELGAALTEAGGGTSVFDTLTGVVKGFTGWLKDHRADVQNFANDLLDVSANALKSLRSLESFGDFLGTGLEGILARARIAYARWSIDQIEMSKRTADAWKRFVPWGDFWFSGVDAAYDKWLAAERRRLARLEAEYQDFGRRIRGVTTTAAGGPSPYMNPPAGGAGGGTGGGGTGGGGDSTGWDRVGNAAKAAAGRTKQAMRDMSTAYAAGLDAFRNATVPGFLQGWKAMQEAAKDGAGHVVDEARQMADATDAMHKANDGMVPDFLKGQKDKAEAWHRERDAANEVTDAFRGGEQYYVNQTVPAFLKGAGKIQKANEQVADTAAHAADKTREVIDALNAMANSLNALGNRIGGVFGKLINGAGGIASGLAATVSGLQAAKTAGEGLGGTLTKIAGIAGGVAGAVGAIGSALGIVGSIGESLGIFHRNKNPGRLRTNEEKYQAALSGSQAALDFLYKMSGRLNSTDGWATDEARDDAWEKYQDALASNPSLRPSGTNSANLRHDTANTLAPGAAPTTDTAMPGGTILTTSAPAPPGAPYEPWRGISVRGFAAGGAVHRTGLSLLHAGETVLSPLATARLGGQSAIAALNDALTRGLGAGIRGGDTSNAWSVNVTLYGVADRDVPRRVVEAIKDQLGQSYQSHSALQGNVRLGL